MGFDLGSLLSQFTGGGTAANVTDHFDKVAQSASPDLLSQGLSAMFHSDQTPPSSTGKRQNFRNEPMKSMTWTQVSRFRVMARMLAFLPC